MFKKIKDKLNFVALAAAFNMESTAVALYGVQQTNSSPGNIIGSIFLFLVLPLVIVIALIIGIVVYFKKRRSKK